MTSPFSIVRGRCAGFQRLEVGPALSSNPWKSRGLFAVLALLAFASHAETPRKWHPGHYVNVWPNQRAASLARHLDSPAIAGVKVFYTWRDLEPRKGEYDFSRIEEDLATAQRHGKQLFITLMEKSWHAGSNPPRHNLPAPDYLLDDATYRGGVVPLSGARAQVVTIWHPAVMDRFEALIMALGKRFDAEPAFEGINTDETACGLDGKLEGFTAESQLVAWKRYASALKRAFPTSTVLVYLNWFPRADELAAHCAGLGVGFGGPDVVPIHSTRLNASRYPAGKPRSKMQGDLAVEKFVGLVPIGHDAQTPIFGGKEGSPELRELLDWAVDGLHCNYVFWPAITRAKYTYDLAADIIPFLEHEQARIVRAMPGRQEKVP